MAVPGYLRNLHDSHVFIHSETCISIYHVPEIVPGSGDTVVSPCLHGASNLIVDSDTNQRIMQTDEKFQLC